MTFSELLKLAKKGDEFAIIELINTYKYLIVKRSHLDTKFDEDLYQDQLVKFLICIKKFRTNFSKNEKYDI